MNRYAPAWTLMFVLLGCMAPASAQPTDYTFEPGAGFVVLDRWVLSLATDGVHCEEKDPICAPSSPA